MGNLQASWTVEIEAARERVFEVAADVPKSTVWQPALITVETLEIDEQGRSILVDTSSDARVKTTYQRLRFSYEAPTGLTFVQEKGDVKSLNGSWVFVEIEASRTEATFSIESDPGRMLGLLLKGPVEGKVKEFLTKGAAEGLKQHIESTDSA